MITWSSVWGFFNDHQTWLDDSFRFSDFDRVWALIASKFSQMTSSGSIATSWGSSGSLLQDAKTSVRWRNCLGGILFLIFDDLMAGFLPGYFVSVFGYLEGLIISTMQIWTAWHTSLEHALTHKIIFQIRIQRFYILKIFALLILNCRLWVCNQTFSSMAGFFRRSCCWISSFFFILMSIMSSESSVARKKILKTTKQI